MWKSITCFSTILIFARTLQSWSHCRILLVNLGSLHKQSDKSGEHYVTLSDITSHAVPYSILSHLKNETEAINTY